MSRRQRAYFSAVVGPTLLVSVFLTAGFALARLDPDDFQAPSSAALSPLSPLPQAAAERTHSRPEEGPALQNPPRPEVNALGEEARASSSGSPTALNPDVLQIAVNYAHEWVAGDTDPSATVAVTVTDNAGFFKDGAVVSADAAGSFFVGCEDWFSFQCFDVQPGDRIIATTGAVMTEISPIGVVRGTIDPDNDVVSAELRADWFPGPLDVSCEVWEENGPSTPTTAETDGGSFTCDFGGLWDLQPFQTVAVRYYEPDGDSVINILDWPWVRVNYAYDQVGANYEAGHSLWVTITDSVGAVKATGTAESFPGGGWGGDGFEAAEWIPARPDIVPHDFVHFKADNGYTATVEVGWINGALDIDGDLVSGPITATHLVGVVPELEVACHPWGAWGAGIADAPVKHSTAAPDGSAPFTCSWDPGTEWDIQPGQDVGVMYVEPNGNRVIDVYRDPAPEVGVWKWHSGGHSRPGGVAVYGIRAGNYGSSPAENVVIGDDLPPGTSYYNDTSGFPVTIGAANVITWDLGTLDPGQQPHFAVTLAVDPGTPAGPAVIDGNCLEIVTTSPGDWNPGNDYSCSDPVDVWDDEVELGVDKWAVPTDPTPGQEFDYVIGWCNHRGAAAGPVVLTDTLPVGVTLLDWRPQDPREVFWQELSVTSSQLVLYAPGLPGSRCEEITLRLALDLGVPHGTILDNLVELAVADDVDLSNNWKLDRGATVSPPRQDLAIGKRLEGAVLVPGGSASFAIDYANNGNIESSVTITDTMPPGFSYMSGRWGDATPWAGDLLPDPTIVGNQLVWDLPTLAVNQIGGLWIELAIGAGVDPDVLENCAEIAGDFVDAASDDNISCTSFTINPPGPNLKVHKWSSWNGDGQLGYTVRFDNTGNEAISSIEITDTLPVGTFWDGWWDMSFDWGRLVGGDVVDTGGQLIWGFSEILPGETGRISFNANLAEPGAPLTWYTNTVEITAPPGDADPDDNTAADVAFSGGEVRRVELRVDPWADSRVWGEAVPSLPVTVTTPSGQFSAWADPGCGGCWEIGNVGFLAPGDPLTVVAGAGEIPIDIIIPDPLYAEIDTGSDEVFGQIGGWLGRPVEVHGAWPDGFREVTTDAAGNFLASYPEIPRGGAGFVRIVDEISYAEVAFQRPFRALDLVLDINYGHDWVAGLYEPGHTVWITVTESDAATVKGTAALLSDYHPGWGDPGFSTAQSGWQGDQPDLQSGDWVFGRVDTGQVAAAQLGDIDFHVDYDTDIVSGTLTATWLSDFVELRCEVWGHPESPSVDGLADPQGGPIFCDFGSAAWDLDPGQSAGVMYWEPDGDRIMNVFDWPQIVASIGPASGGDRFVWGHRAEPNASVAVTVTTELGGFVASAAAPSDGYGNWSTGNDLPEGSLAFWNQVFVDFGNAITDTLTVYPVGGVADPASNVVTVTAAGPPFFSVDLEVCNPASACQWFGLGEIGEFGQVTADLLAEHGYDLEPGSSLHAQLDVWHGHQIRYSWGLPAPEVGVWKRHLGGSARPGGVSIYGVRYGNYGSSPAENVQIVDSLPSPLTSYADDTSGLPVTIGAGGVITWDAGTVAPGQQIDFALTLDIAPATPTGTEAIGENCAAVDTTSPGDWHPDNNVSCAPPVDVWDDEVELGVDKWALPSDPAPGGEFDYIVRWCNSRSAAAGPVVLTDTLPVGVTLLNWQPQDPQEVFWSEISATGTELVLYAPGLPGHRCEEITLRVALDAQAEIGATLVNVADLDVDEDVDPDNNWTQHDGVVVGPPRLDLAIWKRLDGAVLVPGGTANFSIDYANNGNVASSVTITDTLPAGMTYVGGWWAGYTPWAEEPFPDPTVVENQLVWNLPIAPVHSAYGFGFELAIDEGITPQAGLANCAAVAGDGQDATPDDNASCAGLSVQPHGANLRIQKAHTWHGDGKLGYEVRFDNVGDVGVPNVSIVDLLPAGTIWDGWWNLGFDEQRLSAFNPSGSSLSWDLSELLPGETGWIWFNADLDEPGAPLRWYTNTVQISTPPGDTNPADNSHDDVAFSGGEVERVELKVYGRDVWGYAPRGPITVAVPGQEVFLPWDGDFGWTFDEPLQPAQTITVTADLGLSPVVIEIPDPFDVEGSSIAEEVWGQVDHLDGERIEVVLFDGPTLGTQTDSNGSFSVSFPDIPRGGTGEVRYATTIDYTDVVFHRRWRTPDLLFDVNYAHDWIEGAYEPGHTVWITVTESDGATVKGTAELTSDFLPGWTDPGFSTGGGGWQGDQPDLLAGDWVYGQVDNGFTTTVRIGTITGVLDIELDTVSGEVAAPWFVDPLRASCEVWEEGGPAVGFDVAPDGGPYLCDLSAEGWDLRPGQDVAVRYREPDGDSVIAIFRESAPRLRIEKSGIGDPAEGGNFLYHIDVWNEGGAAAESVVITDTLPVGTVYISDTSSLLRTGDGAGPLVWQAEVLDPGQHLEFDLYVDVTASAYVTITNSIVITTSTPFDGGEPSDKSSDWVEQVQPNDTHLTVAKWSRTPDPAPGEDFFFVVNVCNQGTTGSTEVTLTDNFQPLLTLVDWQTGNAAWYEVSRGGGEIVLAVPSIAGNTCSRVRMTMLLDPAAQVGQLLTNSAVIAADNDLEPEDNQASWEGLVTEPRLNLAVEKSFASGSLVPGGSIRYRIDYVNNGNLEVAGPVQITDTFPVGTTFVSAWHSNRFGGYDFPPAILTPDYAVWELPGLDNTSGGNFEILLDIAFDVLPGSLLENRVDISPEPGEVSYDDNTSIWQETVHELGSNLRVVKDHDWNEERTALAYEVSFYNIGSEATGSYTVTDTLPTGATWDGTWNMNFEQDRLVGDMVDNGGELVWQFTEIYPGESGHLWFGAVLDTPDAPLEWYTNTVHITVPTGDIDPDDNSHEDVASGHVQGPSIDVEKLTLGSDADQPPGPFVAVGAPITWTYRVSNTGSVDLSEVEVTDDNLGPICSITSLQVGDPVVTCTATGTATAGQYQNTATVSGNAPPPFDQVLDEDSSHYFGAAPVVTLETLTNGISADTPPGPYILAGDPVTWTYIVTNTGNVTLTSVAVVEEPLGEIPCPADSVAAGASFSCVVTGTAVIGQYGSFAQVGGTPPGGLDPVFAFAQSFYFGIEPSIALEKRTNGVDADTPPGVEIAVGEPITWTYVVTNTGTVDLSDVTVTDDRDVAVTCPDTDLQVGETMTCSGQGVAEEGPYVNVGTVVGHPPTGDPVSASDSSHYLGGRIIFSDDFESGDSSAWDGRAPP